MDFAFGTYSNDALKLANYRANRSGIQHQNHITPLDPTPDDVVTVHVVTPAASGITHAALYVTTDASLPQGSRGIASNGSAIAFEAIRTAWDSNIWDYVTHWQATIPAQPDQTLVRYTISGWSETGDELYADWPNAQDQVQHAAMIYFGSLPEDDIFDAGDPQQPTVFVYHVDTITAPDWAKNAVIYQIFIDRFYAGDGQDWLQTEDIGQPFGGTLWGVRDKLDYLAGLGIDCIWLSPTWVTPSAHGYDVVDYDRVEPRFGGEDALRAVIEGAHERGMRVLLDMVCNHLSDQHPIFREALENEDSPYRDWFTFSAQYACGYRAFFGVESMPQLNTANEDARDWLVGIAQRWLREYDIDGYRLDYANGPGPNFWTYFRRACRAIKPDCLIFGEIIEPSDVLRRYHGRLDGCLDFPLNDALRCTYGWQTWDTAQFTAFANSHRAFMPDGFLLPIFVDNHDMDRFSHIVNNDNEALKQAVTVQMAQPQPAVIYYGCEVGLRQPLSARDHGLEASRPAMIWGDAQDTDLLNFYREQIQSRKRAEI